MSDGRLQAYLDGELAPSARSAVAMHLNGCGECAAELHLLSSASDRLAMALEAMDATQPPDLELAYREVLRRSQAPAVPAAESAAAAPSGTEPAAVAAARGPSGTEPAAVAAARGPSGTEPAAVAAARATSATEPAAARRSSARRRAASRWFTGSRSALARAALLVVAFGGLASAAVPGSPVRSWISAAWSVAEERFRAPEPAPVIEPVTEAPAAVDAPHERPGVAVPLVGGSVVLIFERVPEIALVRIRLVDSDRASVRTDGTGTIPHFGTAPGRIHVSGGSTTEFVVEIPRAAERARVEVEGRVIFAKSGEEVNMRSATGSSGAEIVVPLRQ